MEAFGEEPPATSPTVEEDGNDPAADFLAREQEELGDLGEELGIEGAATPATPASETVTSAEDALSRGVTGLKMSSPFEEISVARIEPETIRVWRAEQEKRLAEKDAKEEEKMKELRDQAQRDLTDWYKHYNEQLEKTKATNRESEKEFIAEVNDITPGTEWERVNKLVDFNTKNSKNTKDMSRMRSIMLQLKQAPLDKNVS